MTASEPATPNELRVLLLAPLGRDAELARDALEEAGMDCQACADLAELRDRIVAGAGVAVVAEEALHPPAAASRLADVLQDQPPWSSLPLVVLTGRRDGRPGPVEELRRLEPLRKVTFLERPLRRVTLVTTVRAGLDARERQYQVRQLLEQLQGEVRSRDRFLATLGHELRNPVGAMSAAVDMLGRVASTDHRLVTARQILERQCEHVGRLLDDLLDVSRIRNDRIRLQRADVRLRDLVRDAVDIVRPQIEARRHVLDTHLPDEEVRLDADVTRLRQVLSNLLDNAAKYTEPGGHISLSAALEGDDVVVSVRDDGIGMDADELSRAFQMFRHGEGRLERETGGLGLGLPIARRLVEMHGGTLEARSEGPGKGSEFVLALPLAGRPEGQAAAPGEEAPEDEEATEHLEAGPRPFAHPVPARGAWENGPDPDRPLKVLLVDDNRDLTEALGALLVAEGYEVRICRDGAAALRIADELRPDVVLLDIGLPDLDGYEVARRLRHQRGLEDALLVAVTGYGQDEDRRHSERAGIDRHLVKPVQLDALREVLDGAETVVRR